MDGATDAANVEDEIVIMSFRKDDTAGVVGSFARYFSIELEVFALRLQLPKWPNNLSQ